MPTTFDISTNLDVDSLAQEITNKFTNWESARGKWEEEYNTIQQYKFAIDSKDIGEQQRNPWNNSNHIPKITQISDILLTMYLESLFSVDNYVVWDSVSVDEGSSQKTRLIQAYAKQVLEDADFRDTAEKALQDFIDAGNGFAMPFWENGKTRTTFISPLDIYFDPTARLFKESPKIIRKRISLGELKKLAQTDPVMEEAFKKVIDNRSNIIAAMNRGDNIKDSQCRIAGVGDYSTFFSSDNVEVLRFYGTLYDITKEELYEDKIITVIDRAVVLSIEDMLDIADKNYIYKAGWRDRNSCLWSMSPLANLTGMQYRIDFLENKRSDVFDFISNPVVFLRGEVAMPPSLRPGDVIQSSDGDAKFLTPDSTALMADTYIDRYMSMMDEMAGTPKEVAGWRSPGEKTAFEYEQLITAAMRLFNKQTRKFEKELFEPLINATIELDLLKRAGQTAQIKTIDPVTGVVRIEELSLDDIRFEGRLRAQGSTAYAERTRLIQSLQQLSNNGLFMSPDVQNNINPDILGKIFVTLTGLDKYEALWRKNARLENNQQIQIDAEKSQRAVDMTKADTLALGDIGGE